MSLRELVASEGLPDACQALEEILNIPPSGVDVLKDEPRTLIWRSRLPSGAWAIVKTYRRRSLYDFTRESMTRFRAQREFESLAFLSKNNVPSVRPICWGYGRHPESGRFESVATFQELNVIGLKDHLRSGCAGDRWIEPAARLVRQGHDIGFYHGALAPRNILVRPAGWDDPACMFIDTPRSIVFPRPITGTRMAEHDLMVLLGEVCGVVGETPLPRFLATYGMPESDIPRLVDRIKCYRPNRNTRNRARAEFLIRRFLS